MWKEKTQDSKQKLTETLSKGKSGVKKAIIGAESLMFGFNNMLVTHAEGDTVEVNPNIQNQSMETIVGGVIGFILELFQYIGVALLVYAIYQTYLSFKDDNPNDKIKGFTLCFVAVGLITIRTILGPGMLGIITYS